MQCPSRLSLFALVLSCFALAVDAPWVIQQIRDWQSPSNPLEGKPIPGMQPSPVLEVEMNGFVWGQDLAQPNSTLEIDEELHDRIGVGFHAPER